MADTEDKTKTRDEVKALLDEGMAVKDIAERLGKTPATIYVHKRNLEGDNGEAPRKRGRPPKLNKDADAAPETASTTEAASKPAVAAKTAAKSNGNGDGGARFPEVRLAIEKELADRRNEVTVLERMLETV